MGSKMNAQPCYVNQWNVEVAWEYALPILKKSFEYCDGKYEPDDVLARLKANTAVLFVNKDNEDFDSALVAWPTVYPRCTVFVVSFAGGKLRHLKAMIPAVKEMAKILKCDMVEVHGRHGWVREFKDIAEHTGSVMRMKI